MQLLAGLRGQSLADPLLRRGRGMSRGLSPLLGLSGVAKPLALTRSGGSLDAGTESSVVTTPTVSIMLEASRRGETFKYVWSQVSGISGIALSAQSRTTAFQYAIPSEGHYPQVWRCVAMNQFGESGAVDVDFTVSRYPEPPPSLVGQGFPTEREDVAIDPATRQATVSFSVSASGGTPPYSYDWGGGDSPNSPSNTATITLPVGATEGYLFGPGCTVTDSADPPYRQSITIPAGPFFIFER